MSKEIRLSKAVSFALFLEISSQISFIVLLHGICFVRVPEVLASRGDLSGLQEALSPSRPQTNTSDSS